MSQEELDEMKQGIWDKLEDNYNASKTYKATSKEWVSSSWSGITIFHIIKDLNHLLNLQVKRSRLFLLV